MPCPPPCSGQIRKGLFDYHHVVVSVVALGRRLTVLAEVHMGFDEVGLEGYPRLVYNKTPRPSILLLLYRLSNELI